jgi:hypothetical protein
VGVAFLSLNFLLRLKERPLGSSRRALFHSSPENIFFNSISASGVFHAEGVLS